ncbi:glycerate kinase [Halobacillus sp. A1]|uniref:glycerate kinase n=1 Tax=Halobacillus sp. A1 TaxID=2880262 RepID=UPI0020A63587|nr:glycerate kinase [Halobacillus sp. A1]MCP3030258.1 glycerate kinase [Halobacillus sp. A1]
MRNEQNNIYNFLKKYGCIRLINVLHFRLNKKNRSGGFILKIVIAPDSFKGSIHSTQAAKIIASAFHSVSSDVETIQKPMADGGEGTLEAILNAGNSGKIHFNCKGPLGEASSSWYVETGEHTAVIESANIAGLPMVPEEKRNPDKTTTYGIGEAIKHALNRGKTELIIAIGGSSTNDGGLGMLQALGMRALDRKGEEVGIYGEGVLEIESLDFSKLDKRLKKVTIRVASDVDNPLTGSTGASIIYGPQKGATVSQVNSYDQALEYYGRLVEKACGKSIRKHKGAGAAGGLGFAFLSIGGEIHSGAKLIADSIGLTESIQIADVVVTGEGKSDEQTLYGKAPGYIAKLAQQYEKPTILISGSQEGSMEKLNQLFVGCFSIIPAPMSLHECITHAPDNLYHTACQVARLTTLKSFLSD